MSMKISLAVAGLVVALSVGCNSPIFRDLGFTGHAANHPGQVPDSLSRQQLAAGRDMELASGSETKSAAHATSCQCSTCAL